MPRRSLREMLREASAHVRLHVAFAWQEMRRKRAARRNAGSQGAPAFPVESAGTAACDVPPSFGGRTRNFWNTLRRRPGMIAAVAVAATLLLGLRLAFDRSDEMAPTGSLRDSGLTIFEPAASGKDPADNSFKNYSHPSATQSAPGRLPQMPAAARELPIRRDAAVVSADGSGLWSPNGPAIVPALAQRPADGRDRTVQPASAWTAAPQPGSRPVPATARESFDAAPGQVRANSGAWLVGTIEEVEPTPAVPAAYAVRSSNAYGPARTPRAVADSVVPTSRPNGPLRR